VGTTDTDYEGDPGVVAADAADVAYLTASARRAFPAAPFDHVYYTWAGVRALGRVEGVTEGQVSRKHRLLDHQEREGLPGLVSVVGGKITAYRGIAEEVGDLLSRRLGRETASYTDRRPFPGAALGSAPDVEAYVEREVWPRAAGMGLTRAQAGRLGRVYGSLAQAVLDLAEADRTLALPVAPGETAIRAELARAVGQEWATSLADVLLRRSDLGLRPDQGLAPIAAIAAALGEICGWVGA
jgi:glycerol-3-phosphate dehydrogenase